MIDMNLANSPSYIVGAYPKGKVKRGAGIIFLIVALILIPLGSVILVSYIFGFDIDFGTNKEFAVQEDQRYSEAAKQIYKNIAKNIMGTPEVAVAPQAVVAQLPVNLEINKENMSQFERMNYEVKFTSLLLEEFTRLVPNGITFNTIRIFNFESVIAEGTSPNQALVSRFLAEFRANTDEWELKARPQTNIRAVGDFFDFRLEANFTPAPLKIIQNPIDPDAIPTRLQLDDVKNRVVRLARSSGLQVPQGLVLASSVNEPNRREFSYNLNFNGSFQQTNNFIQALSLMRESIRTQNLTLTNTPQGSVQGTAQIIISVK